MKEWLHRSLLCLPRVSEWVFPLFLIPSFCGFDVFWENKRLVDSPLWWAEGMLQTDFFLGSCPGMIPHFSLFEKLSWHVLKKPVEEMLARFPLGQAPKRDTTGQWFTSASVFLLFPSPNLVNLLGRAKRRRGRSMWYNLHSGKVMKQHQGACSWPCFYGEYHWETLNCARETRRSTTSVWELAGDVLTSLAEKKAERGACLMAHTLTASYFAACCVHLEWEEQQLCAEDTPEETEAGSQLPCWGKSVPRFSRSLQGEGLGEAQEVE